MGNVQQDIATKMFPPCENNGKRIAYIRQNKTKQNSEFSIMVSIQCVFSNCKSIMLFRVYSFLVSEIFLTTCKFTTSFRRAEVLVEKPRVAQ